VDLYLTWFLPSDETDKVFTINHLSKERSRRSAASTSSQVKSQIFYHGILPSCHYYSPLCGS
jgi:hypothetical protein